MKNVRLRVLGAFTLVTLVSVLLQQAFVTLLFERSHDHWVLDLSTSLPIVLAAIAAAVVRLGAVLAPLAAFARDPGSFEPPARLDLHRRLARLPVTLQLWNLGLFLAAGLGSAGVQVFFGRPFPQGLDLVLILSLNLGFGFMTGLQQTSWIESLTLPLRHALGLTSVEGHDREISLRQRLFLVNLGSVVLSGLLAGMAALGFYREVVAYYTTLSADAVSAASAVSNQAINDNEVKVVVQMGLQFLAVLAWTILLTNTALSSVSRQLRDLSDRVGEMAGGSADLGRRADVLFFDEVGLLTGRINALMARLQTVVGAIQATSAGVLESTGRVRETSREAEANLARVEDAKVSAFQALGGQGEALGRTMDVAQKLEASSGEVRRAAADQHQVVTLGAAAMEQVAESVTRVSGLTAEADRLASALRATSEGGGKSIEAVRQAMESIQQAAAAVAGTVATIKKTASQTNLLAMNAAIEAAHAGASGLGFAVVASEVRSLAENSSQGAKTIAGLMKEMDGRISQGDRLAREAGEAFAKIFGLVVQTSELMGTVARAMDEQRQGTQTILATTQTLREASAHIGTITDRQVEYSEQINQSVMVLLEAGAVLVMAQDVQGRAMADLTDLVHTVARESDQNLQGAHALSQTVEGFTVK